MESEMLPIYQVFRTVQLLTNEKFAKNVAEHVPHLFVPGSGRDEIWNMLS
jgi:hypothetical protein